MILEPPQNKVCHCFSTDHITSAQYSTLEAEILTRLTKFYVTYNPVGIVWMFTLRGTGTPMVGSVLLPLSDSNRMELPLSSEDRPEQLHWLCPHRARSLHSRMRGGERDDRGWDGWMASLTQWTWVSGSSGSWWWAGRPGVLRSMGLQRVGHEWEI